MSNLTVLKKSFEEKAFLIKGASIVIGYCYYYCCLYAFSLISHITAIINIIAINIAIRSTCYIFCQRNK